MSSSLARVVLSFLTLTLLGIVPTEAILVNTPLEALPRMQQSFTDGVALATFASFVVDSCDDVYLRYFPASDVDFVRRIFRRVANLPVDAVLTMNQLPTVLQQRATIGVDPRLFNLMISYGNYPGIREQVCGIPNDDTNAAFTSADGGGPLITMCASAFEMYPDEDEIMNPPFWALNAQGNLLPGYGCDGLGDHDSDLMWFPGAVLMHEIMHFSDLFDDLPNWFAWTYPSNGVNGIGDYDGTSPREGYGPFYSRVLNLLSSLEPQKYRPHEAINNADSYASYALSVWWRWKCQREFGPSVTKADSYNRETPPRPSP
ncbi:hypothetical protein AYL99_11003 [Fonsecaea erecta]|uniref:Lysine-specific metallo-endopeptidase domain-containing protein n=1 Tax=Fonsecaea erecta TaxID=1367422 RepID=A0A178Z672_9EURO|nr:hypothetical protein AYL99_11003 [Fonsecaea erecta]OAP54555.1 hypothetical protein AYL99_11003 [Fonsecaea erecta]